MPGFPKIDEKKMAEEMMEGSPRFVIAETLTVTGRVTRPDANVEVEGAKARQSGRTKRTVIIAITIIVAALIILAAILIGIHMFTEAQKKLIKYTLNFDKNTKQDVTSDPNTNIVQYEILNSGQKTWVVNDFNRDIQLVKIQTPTQTNCYVSALNRTNTRDPTQITGPETQEINKASTLTYITSGVPISDTSFLAQAARDICKGVSTYWLYPKCSDNPSSQPVTPGRYSTMPQPTTQLMDNPTSPMNRYTDNSPWYIYWSYPYNANATVFCVTGCCKTVCACSIDYFWYYSAGSLYCTWVASSCPTYGVVDNPVSQGCTNGPTGLSCPNHSPAALPNC